MRQTLLLLLPRCFITIQVLLLLLFYSSVVLCSSPPEFSQRRNLKVHDADNATTVCNSASASAKRN